MTTTVSAYAATQPWGTEPADQAPPSSAATSARTTSRSTSSSPASATPTSTPSAASGARSTTRSSRATRSPASSPRSAPRSPSYKVGDRVGVGCFVDSCRECEYCKAGEEQYCTNAGMVGTYNAHRPRRRAHPGRLQRRDRRRRELRAAHPRRHPARQGRAAAVRRHHHSTRRCATGVPAPASRSPSSASAASATWASRSPHAMGAEVTVLSQSLKKKEDGLRLGADRVLRDQRPGDVQEAARARST